MKTISRFSLQANFLMPTWIQDRRKSRIEVWKAAEVPVAYPFFRGIGKNFPFFIYCSSQGGVLSSAPPQKEQLAGLLFPESSAAFAKSEGLLALSSAIMQYSERK